MAFNTDNIIQNAFGVVIFMVIIGVIAGSLLSTTDDIPQADPFTVLLTPANFTLTQTNNVVFGSVTNASGTVINAGNYTFYPGSSILQIDDNSTWLPGVGANSLVVNYRYDPPGRLTGASGLLVGIMALVIVIVFIRSLIKKKGR